MKAIISRITLATLLLFLAFLYLYFEQGNSEISLELCLNKWTACNKWKPFSCGKMCWVKNNKKKEACRTQSSIADIELQPKFRRQQKWIKATNSQVSVGKTQNAGGFFIVNYKKYTRKLFSGMMSLYLKPALWHLFRFSKLTHLQIYRPTTSDKM